jgi:hypothetical protein
VVAAATVFSVIGKGLGWRIGGIVILAVVATWAYVLYFMADRRYEQMKIRDAAPELSALNGAQLHKHVCETTDYWEYLHNLLAEVATTNVPTVLDEPIERPTNSAELGKGFIGSERMMRELLDHIVPPKSRYVAYYIFDSGMQASSEVQNGWKGRPPDLQREPMKQELLLTKVTLGDYIVLPDAENPAPKDRKYTFLCFDKSRFRSFAALPLRVDEPVDNMDRQFGMAVGALLIESPNVGELSENFCSTAIQVAADILALAFAAARSSFTGEGSDA